MALEIRPDPPPLRHDRGDVVRIGGTRVPLQTVIRAYLRGDSPQQIAEDYDTLTLADIFSTIAYYLRHPAEVDDYMREQESHFNRAAHEAAQRGGEVGFAERLRARRRQVGV